MVIMFWTILSNTMRNQQILLDLLNAQHQALKVQKIKMDMLVSVKVLLNSTAFAAATVLKYMPDATKMMSMTLILKIF